MSEGFVQRCPSCGSVNLLWVDETYHENVDGSVGSWRRVRCEDCNKIWRVEWNEDRVVNRTGTLKCSQCKYSQKIDNSSQVLNYIALHQDKTGHSGLSFMFE